MKTSQKQTSRNGEDVSMFSREDFHVSRSALPEREKEQKITVISGRKCYEQYGKYSPLGSLVKMLLVSYQWYSPARRLKWDAQTICSTRISYTEQSNSSHSTPSVKTLNVQGIQSNRLLFRLVPSEHLTEETGCGLLPTAQTQGLKVCNKDGKTEFLNLELLPTPKAQEARGNCSVNRNKFNLTDKIAELTSPTSDASQLNPLYVTEMMGYPLEWLTLPFLSQSGEVKASKR